MSIKIFFAGDYLNFTSKKDFVNDALKKIIIDCDISICNFEGPIQHTKMTPIRKAGPNLYQHSESIKILKNIGFNLVSLANNHIYDYGQRGLEITILELERQDISYVGAGLDFDSAYQPKIIEKNNLKIGVLAAGENGFGCLYEKSSRGGYAWLFNHSIEDHIKNLKKTTDFVILIAHAGVEDVRIPIKEWRDRYKRLCDIGVNVVIGHHPHVPQGFERYNKSLIFYSLGNFYFDTAGFERKDDDGFSVIITFEKNKDLQFEIVYHKKVNGQTRMVNEKEVNFNLEYLNSLLYNNYEELNNKICINLWKERYYNYYKIALGVPPLKNKVKEIIKKFLFLNKNEAMRKNLLLLHNIMIDSHRFVAQRALSLITEADKSQ